MLSQRTANLFFVTLMIMACVYFAWVAEGFETSGLLASSGLPSKFFPQLMLGGMALCALLVGALYWSKGAAGGDAEGLVFGDASEARRGILMLAVSIVCYFIWRFLGFVPMAIALGPLSLLAMGSRQPILYFVVLGLTVFVYLVFTHALGIQLV